MTILRRPSPFGELLSLRQAMDRLFEDSFVRPNGWAAANDTLPMPLDVRTTADELFVEAALPGVRPDDVDITVEGGTLTITAESHPRTELADAGEVVREIRRGRASRSVSLPDGLVADRAQASFDHGILTLRIPKAEQVKPRQIRITPTATNGETVEPIADTGNPDRQD